VGGLEGAFGFVLDKVASRGFGLSMALRIVSSLCAAPSTVRALLRLFGRGASCRLAALSAQGCSSGRAQVYYYLLR